MCLKAITRDGHKLEKQHFMKVCEVSQVMNLHEHAILMKLFGVHWDAEAEWEGI